MSKKIKKVSYMGGFFIFAPKKQIQWVITNFVSDF